MAVTPVAATRHPSGWSFASATGGIVNTTVATTLKAAPADSTTRNYITDLQIQSATIGGVTELAIRDGAGGAILWRTQLQTTALPLVAFNFQSPLQGSPGNLLEIVTLAAVTGGVWVNAQGYTAP
jgi:hypothetical protein